MKGLSKPLSSPSRGDKFPPPLMRFLRSNVGSRSRGRSRSSPLFYLRTKKSAPTPIEATQEPSSPKVTCIGQVRVRRSAKSSAAGNRRRRRCWWLKRALFCGKVGPGKKAVTRMFCRFFRAGYCKKVDATEDSYRVYSNSKSGKNQNGDDSESDCYEKKFGSRKGFIESSSNSSPPRNALMLTRCRSAPYRSSSLGGRFWGSPLAGKEEGDEKTEQLQNPSSENVEEEERSEKSVKSGEGIGGGGGALHQGIGGGGGAVHPLLLTRCKSEPARTGERLNPDPIMLRQTLRLDDVQPRSPQNS